MPVFDAEYEPSPWGPIAEEVARYERSDGKEASELVGEAYMILWTVGAQSRKVRKTPLVRIADDEGRYAVIGSMGGAPTHPQWVHNLPTSGTRATSSAPSARSRSSCSTRQPDGGADRERWRAINPHPPSARRRVPRHAAPPSTGGRCCASAQPPRRLVSPGARPRRIAAPGA